MNFKFDFKRMIRLRSTGMGLIEARTACAKEEVREAIDDVQDEATRRALSLFMDWVEMPK